VSHLKVTKNLHCQMRLKNCERSGEGKPDAVIANRDRRKKVKSKEGIEDQGKRRKEVKEVKGVKEVKEIEQGIRRGKDQGRRKEKKEK